MNLINNIYIYDKNLVEFLPYYYLIQKKDSQNMYFYFFYNKYFFSFLFYHLNLLIYYQYIKPINKVNKEENSFISLKCLLNMYFPLKS